MHGFHDLPLDREADQRCNYSPYRRFTRLSISRRRSKGAD